MTIRDTRSSGESFLIAWKMIGWYVIIALAFICIASSRTYQLIGKRDSTESTISLQRRIFTFPSITFSFKGESSSPTLSLQVQVSISSYHFSAYCRGSISFITDHTRLRLTLILLLKQTIDQTLNLFTWYLFLWSLQIIRQYYFYQAFILG